MSSPGCTPRHLRYLKLVGQTLIRDPRTRELKEIWRKLDIVKRSFGEMVSQKMLYFTYVFKILPIRILIDKKI